MATFTPETFDVRDGRTVALRNPTVDDAQPLLDYAREVISEANDRFLTTPEDFSFTVEMERKFIQDHLDDPRAILMLAEHDGNIIGFLDIRAERFKRKRHYVSLGISIALPWRGMGIGTRMMQAMFGWAEAHPVIEKVGLSALSTNTGAIALYHRLGFQEVGRSPRHFKLEDGRYADNVIMYKFVKPVSA